MIRANVKPAAQTLGNGARSRRHLGAKLLTHHHICRRLAPSWPQPGSCEQKKGARKNSGMEGVAHTLGGRRGAALLDVLRKLPRQGVDHA